MSAMHRILVQMRKQVYLTALIILSCHCLSFSQIAPLKAQLLKITALSDSVNRSNPSEKLYLQFDKPYYALGDTIWFKAYLFNSSYYTASEKSGIIYIEIANDSNKVVKQYRLTTHAGLGHGNISLDDKEFATGTYTIRAYTSWLNNFGSDYFFYKTFYVGNAGENNWLINSTLSTSTTNNTVVAKLNLHFNSLNNKPFDGGPLQLSVLNGDKPFFKQKVQADKDGFLNISFNIPSKPARLAVLAGDEKGTRKAIIPVVLNRSENADVQFLPEGGNLIAGLPATIGFKAIGENGRGIAVSGIVSGHDQKPLVQFKSMHNGMGSFALDVKDSESYTAKVTFTDGVSKEYPLPAIKATGTVLHVDNRLKDDSLLVSVGATDDIGKSNGSYFLIGKARGVVCYAAVVNFQKGNLVNRKIAKSLFPAGIVHFTLMSTNYQPVNERLVFVDHQDNLNITLTTDAPLYADIKTITPFVYGLDDKNGRVNLRKTIKNKVPQPVCRRIH